MFITVVPALWFVFRLKTINNNVLNTHRKIKVLRLCGSIEEPYVLFEAPL